MHAGSWTDLWKHQKCSQEATMRHLASHLCPFWALLFFMRNPKSSLSPCLELSHGQNGQKKVSKVILPDQGVAEAQDGADQPEL